MLPSLPQRPIALPPSALIADDLLVDRAGEHHLDDLDGRLSVTRSPARTRLDAELVEHRADLRPAAVHDDRVDAGLLRAA
jgi:hypothetical protein